MSSRRLPLELILKIILDGCLAPRDLASLARVNRRFNQPATEYLYKDLDLWFPCIDLQNGLFDCKDFELFDRSITECPALTELIRSVKLGTHKIHTLWSSSEDPNLKNIHYISEGLAKLHSLERLELSGFTIDFGFILKNGALPNLRQLYIRDKLLDFENLVKCIQLPMLQALTVGDRHSGINKSMSPYGPPEIECRSVLKSLTIHMERDYTYELKALFGFCPELSSLSCHGGSSPGIFARIFSRALDRCRNTLRMLDLNYDFDGLCDNGSGGFSRLNNLKTLKVNSGFLFNSDARDDPALRKGIHTRLPSSLEYLKVWKIFISLHVLKLIKITVVDLFSRFRPCF